MTVIVEIPACILVATLAVCALVASAFPLQPRADGLLSDHNADCSVGLAAVDFRGV